MELFLIIIITAFIVLALWRLDFAVITTLALLPTYLIRFNIGQIPFTLLEVFVITTAVIFFFRYRLYRLSYLKKVIDKLKENSVVLGDFYGGAKIEMKDEKITLNISDEAIRDLVANYIRRDFRDKLFAT